jgi:multiple antibiotic resistance protein
MEWSLLINSFIGMLAILNPIGNVPIFLEHVENEPPNVQRAVALLMAASILICLPRFLFLKPHPHRFGITIPAFPPAGSIINLIGVLACCREKQIGKHCIETRARRAIR